MVTMLTSGSTETFILFYRVSEQNSDIFVRLEKKDKNPTVIIFNINETELEDEEAFLDKIITQNVTITDPATM